MADRRDHFAWLVLPGGAEVVASQAGDGSGAAVAHAQTSEVTAAGFRGIVAERAAVRVSHSLVVLLLALALGITCRELIRPG